jgi:hypothetical protein
LTAPLALSEKQRFLSPTDRKTQRIKNPLGFSIRWKLFFGFFGQRSSAWRTSCLQQIQDAATYAHPSASCNKSPDHPPPHKNP